MIIDNYIIYQEKFFHKIFNSVQRENTTLVPVGSNVNFRLNWFYLQFLNYQFTT